VLNPEVNCTSRYGVSLGLMHVERSFGHDEYLYQVLLHNRHRISKEGMYVIRNHSLYPWHTGGAYKELESREDRDMKGLVQRFQGFDLYSKSDLVLSWDDPYWKELVEEYFGTGELQF